MFIVTKVFLKAGVNQTRRGNLLDCTQAKEKG